MHGLTSTNAVNVNMYGIYVNYVHVKVIEWKMKLNYTTTTTCTMVKISKLKIHLPTQAYQVRRRKENT